MKSWGKIIAIVAAVCFNSVVNAFESGTDYNSANMSYTANSTISQIVVFDSNMQNGGTLTFTVEAHAGGGRPLQHDTGQLKLEYYNGGTLLGSSTTSYATGNLLQMDAWSSGPGDNSEAWSTLSLTSTDCGTAGSCASVTHVKVIMIGTDTSWWAGNYGPQWRVPTVTFTPTGGSAGSNILYNPEFGLDSSGVFAQGWTSSSSWGACGTTSGSVMCTTTAAGVTANMSGGGYDANGGTTAATPGGYTGTLSVTSFSGSSSGSGSGSLTVVSTAPGTPTVTSSSSNGTTTTSVVDTPGSTTVVETVTDTRGSANNKTLTITRNTTVVATTPVTRVVTDTTPVTTTTVTTPTTVTTYSDGSTTTTNGTPVTTTSTTDQVVTTTTTFNQVATTSANQDYTTRVDQYTVLAQTNSFANLLNSNDVLNRHKIVDGDLVFRGNVDAGRSISFYTLGERAGEYANDGYTISTSRYGFGLDKLVRNNWVVGLNVSRSSSSMSGNDSSGNLYKDMIALNSTTIVKNWILSSQLGYSRNAVDSTHSLPALGYSNNSRTDGDDYWFTARLYTPDFRGLRPFVGARVENNRRDAVTEAGSVLTAMSYDAVNTTTNTTHYGLRFDRQVNSFNFYAEASQNSDSVLVSRMGVGKQLTDKVAVVVGATHLKKDSIASTAASIMLRIGF
jgi:hypothetical protein